jgi:hypothetical protein
MDREYSQFEFLSKYDQEIVIQYLGSLHLCEFNSPFASRQSRLIIQALINCDGTEKINRVSSSLFLKTSWKHPC